MNDENSNGSNNFLDRIKESPRTVSALIIILIVAAAIYAFSGEPKQKSQEVAVNNEAATTTQDSDMENAEGTKAPAAPTAPAKPAASPAPTAMREPVTQQQMQDAQQNMPAVERQGNAYVEKAQRGDGITHLARRATTRYLAENTVNYTLTNEHRIYIEDYIQNKLGTDRLNVDDTKTISFDLIAEAVQHAGELNDAQLRHLSHYTSALK